MDFIRWLKKEHPVGSGLILGLLVVMMLCGIGGCECDNKKAKQGDTRVVKKEVPICSEGTAQARSKFVLQCVGKNTLADSDNIGKTKESIKCKSFSEEVYCPLKMTEVTQVYYNKKWISLDERPNTNTEEWRIP